MGKILSIIIVIMLMSTSFFIQDAYTNEQYFGSPKMQIIKQLMESKTFEEARINFQNCFYNSIWTIKEECRDWYELWLLEYLASKQRKGDK